MLEDSFDHSVFSKNRERLMAHDVSRVFFDAVVKQARTSGWLSDEHFTVDGTLIEAWASLKSFRPPGEAPDPRSPESDPGNPTVDFHGETRSNATHQSTTDPEARLMRKGRGKEARLCYGAHAYLACSTMCGAAAEAILLATAIAKKEEATVLRQYNTSGGRRRVENMILGKARQELREECVGYLTLLKYWRDQAAHGKASGIKDNEAYTSLALLLRFAIFVNDNWTELTRK